jgi:hypothetical protein
MAWIVSSYLTVLGGFAPRNNTGAHEYFVVPFVVYRTLCKGNGEIVAWVGSSGTGKSNGFNFVLMEFLEHMGEPEYPETVLLRIPFVLYRFSLKGEKVCVECIPAETLDQLNQYCFRHYDSSSRAVLLLEMTDNESNPRMDDPPVLVSVPSQNAKDKIRTYRKCNVAWMLVAPLSQQEAEEATLLMYYLSRASLPFINEARLKTLAIITEDDILETIRRRYPWMGGKLAGLFSSEETFELHKLLVQTRVRTAHDEITKVLEMEVPKQIQAYISVFHKEGVIKPDCGGGYADSVSPGFEIPSDENPDGRNFCYDFLTPELGRLLLSEPLDEQNHRFLSSIMPARIARDPEDGN